MNGIILQSWILDMDGSKSGTKNLFASSIRWDLWVFIPLKYGNHRHWSIAIWWKDDITYPHSRSLHYCHQNISPCFSMEEIIIHWNLRRLRGNQIWICGAIQVTSGARQCKSTKLTGKVQMDQVRLGDLFGRQQNQLLHSFATQGVQFLWVFRDRCSFLHARD